MTTSKTGINLDTGKKPIYHVKVNITLFQVPTWIQKINQVTILVLKS